MTSRPAEERGPDLAEDTLGLDDAIARLVDGNRCTGMGDDPELERPTDE